MFSIFLILICKILSILNIKNINFNSPGITGFHLRIDKFKDVWNIFLKSIFQCFCNIDIQNIKDIKLLTGKYVLFLHI